LEENRSASATDIKRIWNETCPFPLSLRFIQKFRRQLGYQAKFSKQKPILSEANKLKRLSFARKNVKQRWRNHVFIDETDFQLYSNKQLFWVFRREKFFHRRPRHSPSLKVICGISIYGQVFFRMYSGTINSGKLKILLGQVKRLVKKHFPNPIMVLDNATPHKSKETTKWIGKHFRTLYLPPQSPELNPIETIFAYMKNKIRKENPKSLKKLLLLVKKCWRTIPKIFIKRTIAHTSKLCKLIMKHKGNNNF
jgi:transposase